MLRSGELLDGGEALLETPRLIEDALASMVRISTLLLSEPLSIAARKLLSIAARDVEIIHLPRKTFESLSTIETSQGAMALALAPSWTERDLFKSSAAAQPFLLVASGIQDPGNLGTILRASEAFGVSGVILTRGTVSPWNAKALRASAGTVLRLPVLRNLTPTETVRLLSAHGVKLYGAVARGGCAPEKLNATQAIAIAIGAEAAGLPPELLESATVLSIAIAPQVESLNVAAATAVVLYEVARQQALQRSSQARGSSTGSPRAAGQRKAKSSA